MELQEYEISYEVEEHHWCFRALRGLIFSQMRLFVPVRRAVTVLDAGCGTGFLMTRLGTYGRAFGIDIAAAALSFCRQRGLSRLSQGSVTALPFKSESFDVIVSTDVLYHRAVTDDERALSEFRRILRKGGLLILNVPAHDYLRRNHDDHVHTRHRYTKQEICAKLHAAGLEIRKLSYRNALAFVVLSALKLVNPRYRNDGATGLKQASAVENWFCSALLDMENSLLQFMNMPCGTSIFCIAQKKS
jgi:SAM-dependent methyltransferase